MTPCYSVISYLYRLAFEIFGIYKAETERFFKYYSYSERFSISFLLEFDSFVYLSI